MAESTQASSATATPAVPPPAANAAPAPAVAPAAEPSARNLNNPAGKVEQPANANATQTAPAATEPPKQDPAKTEQPPKPAKRGSGDFLAKMEAERQYRKQERDAKAALAELQKQKAEFEALRKGSDPRADPIGYLEKQGVTFDDLVKRITDREPPKVEDKVSALEKRLEEMRAEQESRLKQMQAEQMAADRAEWERQTVAYVRNNSDKNELVTAFGAEGYIPQIISEYAQAYNKVLDVDEAARMTQEHLESVVEKVAATKWFKSKYQQVSQAQTQQPNTQVADPARVVDSGKQTADAKTLTSSATATAAAVEQARKPLSEAEARAKAIEILQAHMDARKGKA